MFATVCFCPSPYEFNRIALIITGKEVSTNKDTLIRLCTHDLTFWLYVLLWSSKQMLCSLWAFVTYAHINIVLDFISYHNYLSYL